MLQTKFKSFLGAAVVLALFSSSSQAAVKHPNLVVMIVIDQFRADYLSRFESRFLPAKTEKGEIGGFRYLMNQGAYFPQGQYDIIQSVTAPGHATVLTGAYPYQSGISSNHWYDPLLKSSTYCTDDPNYPIVSQGSGSHANGVSPNNLFASTVGDELKNAGFPSRVISIALKDRAAVLMGGRRADLALWFSSTDHQWVSSKYYVADGKLPAWVKSLNQETVPPSDQMVEWKLPQEKETGQSSPDSKALNDAENAAAIGGVQFPHRAVSKKASVFSTPLGIELTRVAAERAIANYKMGQGKYTDLLAVSFSSHDYVAHSFGLNSREMEELTIKEDRELSILLNTIQRTVPGGLKQSVIILTGDHGAGHSPEWAVDHKLKAGRVNTQEIGAKLNRHLCDQFGKPADDEWVVMVDDFNFYLNRPAFESKQLKKADVESVAKAFLLKSSSDIAYVYTSSEIESRKLPPGIHERQILHSYFPGRSADLTIIPRPNFIAGGPGQRTAGHGTGYSYDRTVPIILSGYHIKSGMYSAPAGVIDIASTLSFLTGTIPPSLSEGRVLSEILKSD